MFKPKLLSLLSPSSCLTAIPFIEGFGFKSEDEPETRLPCDEVEFVDDDSMEEVIAGKESDDGLVHEIVPSCTCL